MISDLSPGDKLSLKGKIFELQKKLQIIDIRNKQKEEFSYRPTLYNYELPDRHSDVLESINKAELIRKQKKEMLQAAVLMQSEEGCTFAPTITRKSRVLTSHDNRPVHMRLTEKGKDYAESIDQMREKVKKFDDHGRKLFTPAINKELRGTLASSITSKAVGKPATGATKSRSTQSEEGEDEDVDLPPPPPPAAADEFLYQDARDREERCRLRERELQAELAAKATAPKMNASSLTLLRRKAEREAGQIFRALSGLSEADASTTTAYSLGIDDIQRATRVVCHADKWPSETLNKHVAAIWALLDFHQRGAVDQSQFQLAAVPLLLHASLSSALEEFHRQPCHHCVCAAGASGFSHVPNALTAATQHDLAELRAFLQKVAVAAQRAATKEPTTPAFQPHIYDHSYKLALRKERKEREQIEDVLAMSRARALLGDDGESTSGSPADSTLCQEAEEVHATQEQELDGSVVSAASTSKTAAVSHHDIMYARAWLKQQNLERIAQELDEKKMRECTFQPKVIPVMASSIRRHTTGSAAAQAQDTEVTTDSADTAEDSRLRMNVADLLDGGTESLSLADTASEKQQVSPRRPGSSRRASESVHNRLYNLKDRMKAQKLSDPSPRLVEEMQACTFAPQLQSSFLRKGEPKVGAPPTEAAQYGTQKSIERIRAEHQKRVRRAEEESHEKQHERLNESYARSRELARQGVVPFKFVLEERRDQQAAAPEVSPKKRGDPADLIVDVKLSTTRTAKIQIWRGDDPRELATTFARVYSLDVKTRDLLVSVIHQSMEENGLTVPVQQEGESLLEEERSYADREDCIDHTPGDLEVLLAGQDMLYVEDEYDSQSSVSSASSNNDASSAEGSRSDGSDDASLDSHGSRSAYLTA